MSIMSKVFKCCSTCGTEKCTLYYDGSKDAIHFLSKETASVAELGYKYLRLLVKDGITFSRFCKLMTDEYKGYNPIYRNFMSLNTFLNWVLFLYI